MAETTLNFMSYEHLSDIPSLVKFYKNLCKPQEIFQCTGSLKEKKEFIKELCEQGIMHTIPDNETSYVVKVDPRDSCSLESNTYLCSNKIKPNSAVVYNHMKPDDMKKKLYTLFNRCMEGRTMYIVPFILYSDEKRTKYGVELTDSLLVVLNLFNYYTIVDDISKIPNEPGTLFPYFHSCGHPLKGGEVDSQWPHNVDNAVIAYFLEEPCIWSYGSSFVDNSMISPQTPSFCFALQDINDDIKLQCSIYKVSKIKHETHYIAEYNLNHGNESILLNHESVGGWQVEFIYSGLTFLSFKNGYLNAHIPETGYMGSVQRYIFNTFSLDDCIISICPRENESMNDRLLALMDGRKSKDYNSRIIKKRKGFGNQDFKISGIIWPYSDNLCLPVLYESDNWNEGVHISSLTLINESIKNNERIKRDFVNIDMSEFFNRLAPKEEIKTKFFLLNYDSKDTFDNPENYRHVKRIYDRLYDKKEKINRQLPWNKSANPTFFEKLNRILSIQKKYSLSSDLQNTIKTFMKDNTYQFEPQNLHLTDWVENIRKLCTPNDVHWCDGSDEEYEQICKKLVESKTFIPLNEKLRPNSFLARSDPRDVARVESKTFICSLNKEDAGPTNNWYNPKDMKEKLSKLLKGCMKGRTMYVIPFAMGPLNSPYSKFGVQITDSPYVVANMRIMVRIGKHILKMIKDNDYMPCLHSVGVPLNDGQTDVPWPCNPDNTVIAHFPEEYSVVSYGSGYGGNALLGKKCLSLRIASKIGQEEGWLAEHMLLLGISNPDNEKYYISAAFPSSCGKTNLAMMVPTIPGWKVTCVGDDISWLHVGENGVLYGINPETGFFGVAPGTSYKSNSNAMETIKKNTIFTNVALTKDGDVWWEGMTDTPPSELIDWQGNPWTPSCGRLASHPNARYTTPASQCPVIDPEWENPDGVPLSAIIFGGRRESLCPLVFEAFTWNHGVFLGSIVSSEQTAAAEGKVGQVRRDPFAMLPFCGYNMGDYFQHWIDFRNKLGYNSPKIFYVNWFRKENGKFIWPGFGENSRVLKWITQRLGRNPEGKYEKTPIGYLPSENALDFSGLSISNETIEKLFQIDEKEWLKEIDSIKEFYLKFGDKIPKELTLELDLLERRLKTNDHIPTDNKKLIEWVNKMKKLCKPSKVHWCTGTEEEYEELCEEMVKNGTLIKLNEKLRPNSYLARSDPRDVARVESKTFICTTNKLDAGPTNNWADPQEMKKRLEKLYDGCMEGRTMYIIPFLMGPLGSKFSKFGVEITDSPYVVINMKIMTRMGTKVLNSLGEDDFFLPCLHSVGYPLRQGTKDIPWPCDPENTIIAHFPEDPSVMSYGSGYGGNALLGKKCYALRLASTLARKEGWLAEHMLILCITNPQGKKYYMTAAFPSSCGKTNLAMMVPTLKGWSVKCVGDDIAWLHVGEDGRLRGINPEAGFFGVAPGTSYKSNASAMETIKKNTIFTNVALTKDGDVWWEGMTDTPPSELIDWQGNPWTPSCGRLASHPNARYTTPASQCPVIDPEWENPDGVPICAILFGGRRNKVVPLVTEAYMWEQGVFMGSIISSEQTAAAEGKIGSVRRDPFAMLPFCGYNMGDYFQHWMDFRKMLGFYSPKIFYVNWFRKENGKYLWPGFGENSRVLKWICERVDGTGKAKYTALGYTPTHDSLDTSGLNISEEDLEKLTSIDPELWKEEIPMIRKYYKQFGERFPELLYNILDDFEYRLINDISHYHEQNQSN